MENKRILIVEDDKASLTFMKVLFNVTDAEIVIVQSGHEAINLYMNDKNFDLILMDIQLPDINGLEVTKVIKGMNKHVPVIAQTAYAMYGDENKCFKAGCDDYISKPIEISDLFYKMDRFLTKLQ
ncbi:MAG: response regulator [Bacteroidales bacterium]|nr:response regulator [Bacteroidales bacterium]